MVCSSRKSQVIKSYCACPIDRLLHQRQGYIFITNAQPCPGPKSFTVYQIRLNDMETKRRYSDFESLRHVLGRLYPIFIVPPIPEKHSLLDYASLQNRVTHDITTIEKRKRMLQTFLNQVAKHPYLGHNHLFHQFLDPNIIWADVLQSPPLLTLAKQHPLHFVLPTSSSSPWSYHPLLSHRCVPSPPITTLQRSDPILVNVEEKSVRLSNFMQHHIEKSQRKVIRRLGELANDYAELGAAYNGFSLNETEHVARAIERMGQTVDDAYTDTGQMAHVLETEFVEPIQSQAQMARLVKQVIEFQYLKQCQVDLIAHILDSRKQELDRLVQIGKTLQDQALLTPDDDAIKDQHSTTIDNAVSPNHPLPTLSFASRLLNSASYSLQSMVDMNPAATRRNHIEKLKESLQILQEALAICRNDINLLTEQLHTELERYEEQKTTLLKDIMMTFAATHLRHCEKNLQAWQDTKAQVDQIPLDK
ncbi:hypothetical protein BC941DRAFT_511626 [Chlamydoabsidia padenii]|nr:hypothetical protein BC941DRAFT_511626 [Chlamydoabsidia padenii]